MLDCHNFSIAQWIERSVLGSAALVLDLILIAALVRFASDRFV